VTSPSARLGFETLERGTVFFDPQDIAGLDIRELSRGHSFDSHSFV
jgi:hypothetical protein